VTIENVNPVDRAGFIKDGAIFHMEFG